MTNFEIRALLIKGSSSEDELLLALNEAKRRVMPDLISMSSQALQSASLRIRLGAIALLSETRDPIAVPYLIQRLDDPDLRFASRWPSPWGCWVTGVPARIC